MDEIRMGVPGERGSSRACWGCGIVRRVRVETDNDTAAEAQGVWLAGFAFQLLPGNRQTQDVHVP